MVRMTGDPATWSQDDRDWYQYLLRVAGDKDKEIAELRARVAELEAAAKSASFHYWNCNCECDRIKQSMANLAKVAGYSDPAVDDEINAFLNKGRARE